MPNQPLLSRIMPAERRSVGWAMAWFYFAMLSYAIVRPVRETMGIAGGTGNLPWLFMATFLVMLAAVPVYSALASRLPRRWLVRVVYHFFTFSLVVFCLLMQADSPLVKSWTAKVFFVWVSVFAFYNTSVFWSVLTDLFSNQQAKRLFGLIAAGATLGAISGSLFASLYADRIPTALLILLPAIAIEAGLWCAWRLEKQSRAIAVSAEEELHCDQIDVEAVKQKEAEASRPLAGGLFTGVSHVVKTPYLVAICVFVFFVQIAGTQLYLQQAEIINANVPTNEARITLFARIDLGTQLLTLLAQTLLAGPLLRRLGVSVALVVLPLLYFGCFAALSSSQTLGVLVAAMILARSATYGIAVPSSEVLFTVVSREDKYKSKNLIDTVLRRGSDAVAMRVFGWLQPLMSMPVMALCMLPITLLWMIVAWMLGQSQRRRAKSDA